MAFNGHALMWGATVFFLFLVAGLTVAMIVASSWGIGLAAHGYFSVYGPEMRKKWIAGEVGRRLGSSSPVERKQLESKHSRTVGELSASIAHEIRNPVTAAKSLLQQIGEDPSSEDNMEYAKIALEELDRVEQSISHLLRFAREQDLDVRDMNLEDTIESALDTFRDRIESSDVDIERDVEPCSMRGDPEKIRRVVINLVGNALDAVDENNGASKRVRVSSGNNLADTEVWLRVKDNGEGIEPDRLDKIFSPFHTSKKTGTGLGLAITKKVVEAHGGLIEVTSDIGAGTEFTVVFPKGDGVEASDSHR
jgi:signal transduction histidine kinase